MWSIEAAEGKIQPYMDQVLGNLGGLGKDALGQGAANKGHFGNDDLITYYSSTIKQVVLIITVVHRQSVPGLKKF